jgi:hypothetical protein
VAAASAASAAAATDEEQPSPRAVVPSGCNAPPPAEGEERLPPLPMEGDAAPLALLPAEEAAAPPAAAEDEPALAPAEGEAPPPSFGAGAAERSARSAPRHAASLHTDKLGSDLSAGTSTARCAAAVALGGSEEQDVAERARARATAMGKHLQRSAGAYSCMRRRKQLRRRWRRNCSRKKRKHQQQQLRRRCWLLAPRLPLRITPRFLLLLLRQQQQQQ